VAITISQTIGVGMITDGLLIQGHRGMAGEFGHVQVDPRGPTCCCGAKGCWEVMASNIAAVRYHAELSSGTASALDFKDLLALASKGNELADRALPYARWSGSYRRKPADFGTLKWALPQIRICGRAQIYLPTQRWRQVRVTVGLPMLNRPVRRQHRCGL
jgi:hypothetical protein